MTTYISKESNRKISPARYIAQIEISLNTVSEALGSEIFKGPV